MKSDVGDHPVRVKTTKCVVGHFSHVFKSNEAGFLYMKYVNYTLFIG